MPQIQLDEQTFKTAQQRAADWGYPSVEAYITDVVAHDAKEADATPDLDHRFTPEVVADLEQISAAAKGGEKTFSSEEVLEHFRRKAQATRTNQEK